ncbi:uncharacterized protein BDZ99DRAFT_403435 [Mytilinidion resinicola]|uniref:Uncharacterized protein n=1 Tax=Mytilinidion resinicola TaxID=574789 RepID=A0A6A6Y0M2_9PEZI|nr:uncharacterized protein BDZ99DRAFT_403435 [Mytilinidion resinicola]KAF2801357.1 hypothetical protein BDZ99DRAFT_403435 [Mytilinidion resinicola]
MDDGRDWVPVDIFALNHHTMGDSLNAYVLPKIHQEISSKGRSWSRIIVRGSYERDSPAIPADTEKSDKAFNFHRPTATILDDNTIAINCFPGRDYVRHYAKLIAVYLLLTKKEPNVVHYKLPSEKECLELFLNSNLKSMGKVDCVIVGYVHHLLKRSRSIPPPSTWEGSGSRNIFAWHKIRLPSGATAALLGCMPSFWGDISRHLIHALRTLNQITCIIYVGKGGSLNPRVSPNEWLSTGNKTNSTGLQMDTVEWRNVLQADLSQSRRILQGDHINVYSPLVESMAWLHRWRSWGEWVDCEVGHMARECLLEGNVHFGHLHIVSDNVTETHPYDLSNEELEEVKVLRRSLLQDVDDVLESFFSRWNEGLDNLPTELMALH